MTQLWFLPVAVLIGTTGTKTALAVRHLKRTHARDRSWWVLPVLSWMPLAFWILSQFIAQD